MHCRHRNDITKGQLCTEEKQANEYLSNCVSCCCSDINEHDFFNPIRDQNIQREKCEPALPF
jgi:hypothetical protein